MQNCYIPHLLTRYSHLSMKAPLFLGGAPRRGEGLFSVSNPSVSLREPAPLRQGSFSLGVEYLTAGEAVSPCLIFFPFFVYEMNKNSYICSLKMNIYTNEYKE